MALTATGALKIAAKKLGLTPEEYTAKRAAGLKWCTSCRQWKPVDQFAHDLSRGDGRKAGCRACDYQAKRPGPTMRERKARLASGLLWCSGCERWFPRADVHNGTCRPCLNAKRRARYAADEGTRQRARAATHARKRGVAPVSTEAALLLPDQFDGRCAYCTAPATTCDHIVPVSKGGQTDPWNVVPACASCNASKGNRDVGEWLDATGRTPHERMVDRLVLEYCGLPR